MAMAESVAAHGHLNTQTQANVAGPPLKGLVTCRPHSRERCGGSLYKNRDKSEGAAACMGD